MSYDLLQCIETGKYSVRVTNSKGEYRWLDTKYRRKGAAERAGQREMTK